MPNLIPIKIFLLDPDSPVPLHSSYTLISKILLWCQYVETYMLDLNTIVKIVSYNSFLSNKLLISSGSVNDCSMLQNSRISTSHVLQTFIYIKENVELHNSLCAKIWAWFKNCAKGLSTKAQIPMILAKLVVVTEFG